MKKVRNLISVLVISFLLGAILVGCGSSNVSQNSKAEQTENKKPKIAVILKTLSNPFWVAMKDGIEAEAKSQGVTVDVLAVDSEDDVQGQLKKFEDVLAKDYSAIGFAPISPVNLISAVAQASSKGIPVVNIDQKVDMKELKAAGGKIVSFVTTDNVKVGEKGAKYIIDTLGSSGGQVAILEGKAGAASGEDRKNGATAAFKGNSAIDLVTSQPADWDRDKALNVTSNLIQRYPNLKAIYACNDTMALGAVQAAQNAGKHIIIVGTDGAPEAIQAVKDGTLGATVAQDAAQVGAVSVKALMDAIKNKKAGSDDPEYITVDSKLVAK